MNIPKVGLAAFFLVLAVSMEIWHINDPETKARNEYICSPPLTAEKLALQDVVTWQEIVAFFAFIIFIGLLVSLTIT